MFNALQTVVIAIILAPAASKIPLFIGGFFPMTSMYYDGWTGGNGILPAADMALEHINSAGILGDYELKMIWNDTRGSPGWTEHLLYQFLSSSPRKIMLLGAGYSSCSTVVAALAGLNPWRIPQISYASTSPALSDKILYPYFYRTIPDDTSFNAPRFAILKTFNWSHVGIIYQDEDIHRAAVEHLQLDIRSRGMRELTAEAFRNSATTQMANLKAISGGSPPSDRIQQVNKLISPSLILYGFMVSTSIICILIAFFFLWFNTRHKNIRYIKMSSPNLNNIIILGCVLNYVSVATFGLDGSLVDHSYHFICASRSWTLSLGFSLAYGAMFSKTWRVHTIFTNRKLRGKIVKDRHLLAIVFLLLVVDVTYLIIWQSIDPLKRILYEAEVEVSSHNHVEIVYQMEHCQSSSTYLWLGILFGYKGILLLFGAFLAWETRKVTITALNDSKYIGFSVYNVFILCAIGVPVSLVLKDHPDASFSIISILIIFGTSLTICFVFIPKVTELRKHMQVGGRPEPIERTFTVGSVSRNNLDDGLSTLNSNHRREIQEYKDKLEEKEEEIITLRKRLQGYEEIADSSKKQCQDTLKINNLQAANTI
ncbi:gamma-aminobutyric acid type B receptor subunit 2-like [Actinia tenebrosa]|uniref:Gamma-aminobutyric acid type B receptor subunit 2-like n=1 Tax=Actinia tenebrosa TaxID=6105 RepID=A0A6P8HS49_ACTTE|nr:gamma-aminobutyric acid type B receptor subunit 2-like [Actinia tenebrosa]